MITPLEIKEKRFKSSWPGFKKKEVLDFLDLLSSEFQILLREKRELLQQLEEVKAKQKELLDHEATIKNVLIIAQESAEQVRQNAGREAELMIKEAEFHIEKDRGEAQQERQRITQQIEDLKASHRQLKAKMQATLEMYTKLLEDDDL